MLNVHFYGGSITVGVGAQTRFTDLIQDFFPNFNVKNFGIAASGVQIFVNCGIDHADIIVSEFALNEGNKDLLTEWYKQIKEKSKHVIILDIWSWLNPPQKNETKLTTNLAYPNFKLLNLYNDDY